MHREEARKALTAEVTLTQTGFPDGEDRLNSSPERSTRPLAFTPDRLLGPAADGRSKP
jgi:hypothetical protein